MSRRLIIGASATALAVATSLIAAPTFATSEQNLAQQIATSQLDTTPEEVMELATNWATEQGISPHEALSQMNTLISQDEATTPSSSVETTPISATTSDPLLNISAQIAQLSPGATTPEAVANELQEMAASDGRDPIEIGQEALAQGRESIALNQQEIQQVLKDKAGTSTFRAGIVWGDLDLPDAQYKGDVYFSVSQIVTAGHVGIYGDKKWVVEASGPGYNSDWWWTSQIKVFTGRSSQQYFHVTQATQNAAADYAYYHLRHLPYNYVFWNNKKEPNPGVNCSQLVWLAYLHAGVDLDSNGGSGVWPKDTLNSNYAYVYQQL